MIEEKDLNADLLSRTVSDIINDEKKLKELSSNALKLGNPNVLDDIVKAVESI